MNRFLVILLVLIGSRLAEAGNLDTIGATLLRQFDPTLLGNGINVALVEASDSGSSPPIFEVNPDVIGLSSNLFTFHSILGSSSTFPNDVGAESGHANGVADALSGAINGVAPQVSHVENYDAEFYYNTIIQPMAHSDALPRIVNQSFVFDQDFEVEQRYDDYAVTFNTLFVSGAALNFTRVHPAGSSFNGLAVGVSDNGNPPFGPTLDGRCKPDIVAPGNVASFATPYVAGCAAVLLQAATREDAGSLASSTTNQLTMKALLLNGAIKPTGWTNSPIAPLDLRSGAGVVNVFNSWVQLKGGRHAPIESTTVLTNASHPSGTNFGNILSPRGWDYRSIKNSASTDQINHYYFSLPGSDAYTLTATLVWNRQQSTTNINDLNLFLYDTISGSLIAESVSPVDNVEHVSVPRLPAGRYDLQVFKRGSTNQVSAKETYALAFELFNMPLKISITNNQIDIAWPATPSGFTLYSTDDLTSSASWNPVAAQVSINTNTAQSSVLLPVGESSQFFRLQRP